MQMRRRILILSLVLPLLTGWVSLSWAAQAQWFHVRRALLTTEIHADREPGQLAAQPIPAAARPSVLMWVEIELTPEGVVALKARRNMPVIVVWRKAGRAFRKGMDIGITENAFQGAANGIYRWRTWIEVPLEHRGPIEAVVQDARKRFVRALDGGAGMFRMELSVDG